MPKATCQYCAIELAAPSFEDLAALLAFHEKKCSQVIRTFEEEEEWDEKTPSFMTFDEVGDEVIGKLEALDTIILHDKEIRRARVRTSEGVKSFLLTTQLEPLILDIPAGTTIRVKYEGETLSAAKRKVKQFRVWVKKLKEAK